MNQRKARSIGVFQPDGAIWRTFKDVMAFVDRCGHLHVPSERFQTSLPFVIEWEEVEAET
ncbi:MAG: hypothetical protein IPM55_21425 [Acidobacteria bacterium]|jgi:hypothetical protein|nr:hypothetical protein [Acidobacteriota bacterium]